MLQRHHYQLEVVVYIPNSQTAFCYFISSNNKGLQSGAEAKVSRISSPNMQVPVIRTFTLFKNVEGYNCNQLTNSHLAGPNYNDGWLDLCQM